MQTAEADPGQDCGGAEYCAFKKLLAAETDPVKRQTIECLLAGKEAKPARALADKWGARKEL